MRMNPGLPFSLIPQCKSNCHEDAYRQLFQATGHFKPTLIEAHQASKKICNVRSLKARQKTQSFLQQIIVCSIEVFIDFESGMVGQIRNLGIATCASAESIVVVQSYPGSSILTPEVQATKSDRGDIVCIFVKLYTMTYWKDWLCQISYRNSAMHFITV